MSLGLFYATGGVPPEPERKPARPDHIVYVDSDAVAQIRLSVLAAGGVAETGGWLASRGAATIVDVATSLGPEDRAGPGSLTRVFTGDLNAKLARHGLQVSGLWHTHPPDGPLELSSADIAASFRLLDELDLLTVTDLLAVPDAAHERMSLFAWTSFRSPDGKPHSEPAEIVVLPEALRFSVDHADIVSSVAATQPAVKAMRSESGCRGCGHAFAPGHPSGRCFACRGAA
jgi:hypothetical protein